MAPPEFQWVNCIVEALREIGHEAHIDIIEPIASRTRGPYQVSATPDRSVSEMLQLHCANGPGGPKGRALFFKCEELATYDLAERRQQPA
jgi:hypothetical protein